MLKLYINFLTGFSLTALMIGATGIIIILPAFNTMSILHLLVGFIGVLGLYATRSFYNE